MTAGRDARAVSHNLSGFGSRVSRCSLRQARGIDRRSGQRSRLAQRSTRRGAKRTMAWPSRGPRRRAPSTRGRRSLRTSPESARRAAMRVERVERALPAAAAHQSPAAAPSSRWSRRSPSGRAASPARRHRSASVSPCASRDRRIPRPTSMSPMSCMSMKRLTCAVAVDAGERGAQFLQRVGAERREGDEPADAQHATELGERWRQVARPIAARDCSRRGRTSRLRTAAPRCRRRRSAASLAARRPTNAAKTRATPTAAARAFARATREHRQRDVERDLPRVGIANREVGLRVAGAATGVEDRGRRELHDVEPLGHPRADLPLQDRGGVVGRRGAGEMAAHRARIERCRDRRSARRLSGHRESRRAHRTNASACDRNGTCAAPGISANRASGR